jgi:hypothetical protein
MAFTARRDRRQFHRREPRPRKLTHSSFRSHRDLRRDRVRRHYRFELELHGKLPESTDEFASITKCYRMKALLRGHAQGEALMKTAVIVAAFAGLTLGLLAGVNVADVRAQKGGDTFFESQPVAAPSVPTVEVKPLANTRITRVDDNEYQITCYVTESGAIGCVKR